MSHRCRLYDAIVNQFSGDQAGVLFCLGVSMCALYDSSVSQYSGGQFGGLFDGVGVTQLSFS